MPASPSEHQAQEPWGASIKPGAVAEKSTYTGSNGDSGALVEEEEPGKEGVAS